MDTERNLTEQLHQLVRQHELEALRWQREKQEYQQLCQWYANSTRYQLGGLMVNALKHPGRLLRLPFDAYKLLRRHKVQPAADIESNIAMEEGRSSEDIWRPLPYPQIETAIRKQTGHITVIVPVYNAAKEVYQCIASLRDCLSLEHTVLIVNDCSTDPALLKYLEEISREPGISVLNNSENMGFVHSVNAGIRACEGDVVLLNSDTIVTPGWLFKLVVAAYSDPTIMTVTPCSNAAGVFSVPNINQDNPLPANVDLYTMAKLVEQQAAHNYETVPTGNGFCMYIKRTAFEEAGLFDEEAFYRGYGEENDFCMRLLRRGYRNIFTDDTYIFHRHNASFGAEKARLLAAHREILLQRYPDYNDLAGRLLSSPAMERSRIRIRKSIQTYLDTGILRRRIMYVIHSAGGGSVKTNEDLMCFMETQPYDVYLLNSDCSTLRFYRFENGALHLLQEHTPGNMWSINVMHDMEWRSFYFNLLYQYHIDLVHIRHLYKHTVDIIDAARLLKLPAILSFHDFYYICPTINLINQQGRYCNADCPGAKSRCYISEPAIRPDDNIEVWVKRYWRPEWEKIFARADAFITTSAYSKALYERIYPSIGGRLHIIEHGRDFDYPRCCYGSAPQAGKRIRILLAGNLDYAKGTKYIRQLLAQDYTHRLELHCIGNIDEDLKTAVHYHGKYLRNDFKDYVCQIRPAYVGIFSIWPETYCHIMTEAFSCGLPCIVSDIGTLRERAGRGGCLLADLDDAPGTYRRICAASDNPDTYSQLCAGALAHPIRSIAEMANDYLALYEELYTHGGGSCGRQ